MRPSCWLQALLLALSLVGSDTSKQNLQRNGQNRDKFCHTEKKDFPISEATVNGVVYRYFTWTSLNEPHGQYCYVHESAIQNGIDVRVMGFGEVMDNDDRCYNKVSQASKLLNSMPNEPNNTLLFFIDGVDVLFNARIEKIIEQYLSFNATMVFGGELECFTDNLWTAEDCKTVFPQTPGPYRYLNSGVWIGKLSGFRELIRRITEQKAKQPSRGGDQGFFAEAYQKYHSELGIVVDSLARLVINIFKAENDMCGLKNCRTGETPSVWHFNGFGGSKLKPVEQYVHLFPWYKKPLPSVFNIHLCGGFSSFYLYCDHHVARHRRIHELTHADNTCLGGATTQSSHCVDADHKSLSAGRSVKNSNSKYSVQGTPLTVSDVNVSASPLSDFLKSISNFYINAKVKLMSAFICDHFKLFAAVFTEDCDFPFFVEASEMCVTVFRLRKETCSGVAAQIKYKEVYITPCEPNKSLNLYYYMKSNVKCKVGFLTVLMPSMMKNQFDTGLEKVIRASSAVVYPNALYLPREIYRTQHATGKFINWPQKEEWLFTARVFVEGENARASVSLVRHSGDELIVMTMLAGFHASFREHNLVEIGNTECENSLTAYFASEWGWHAHVYEARNSSHALCKKAFQDYPSVSVQSALVCSERTVRFYDATVSDRSAGVVAKRLSGRSGIVQPDSIAELSPQKVSNSKRVKERPCVHLRDRVQFKEVDLLIISAVGAEETITNSLHKDVNLKIVLVEADHKMADSFVRFMSSKGLIFHGELKAWFVFAAKGAFFTTWSH